MRFAENNRISHRQLYRQMILALLAPFMLCVFGKGGMNGISAVAGMIFALILLGFYVIWLIRLTSQEYPADGLHSGRFWYVLSEPAKVYREEEEWRKYQVVCFLAGL